MYNIFLFWLKNHDKQIKVLIENNELNIYITAFLNELGEWNYVYYEFIETSALKNHYFRSF